MTEEQAARIIALLESIDKRLGSVIDGYETLNVTVMNTAITVETGENSLAVYEPRS
jgi:hypothetical protein